MRLNFFLVTVALVFSMTGCDNDVEGTQALTPLRPASLDADAGTWRGIVMTTPDQISVAAPAAITSDGYRAELQALKDTQASLTNAQKDAIAYWGAGGVLRWNEILRGLVARFNLPPAPLANGNYPAPDAENPFGDPNFPFANPPYAARAYSYVAAAQYDALKSAWHYKFVFNRQAPYVTDAEVQAYLGKSDLPSYPSEDAVLSGVTAEVLKLLFPAAVEEITLKSAEQRSAALWAGKATASDISAGLSLGKSVATLFIDRARTDGMSTAAGNRMLWQILVDECTARGEIPWQSMETPPRPPMLPFFGLRKIGTTTVGVKAWMMSNAEIVNERPAPPPSTSSTKRAEELAEVKYYAENLTRDRLAIVHNWADGAGTYTPPGHWNEIASRSIESSNFSEVRAARAFALLNMALHDAAVGCWETKYHYFNPRPSQLDQSIKTATGLPNFPAYTSGHSTFSAAAATVLGYLFPSSANDFNDMALEASFSRLYGGIHYRSDCEMGLEHGKRIAGYTVRFGQADGAD
jgi:hypothetical protein